MSMQSYFFFFFNDTATTEIYTLSLHDRSSDLLAGRASRDPNADRRVTLAGFEDGRKDFIRQMLERFGLAKETRRSEEHTSELQSRLHLVCRLLLEKKKKKTTPNLLMQNNNVMI